ncbi:MAG TPA: amino acid permease [Vicinamibacteria bacterium]
MSERKGAPADKLSLWSGVGLVAANMIGAGVFLSAGFMAQEMGPGAILLAWLVGTGIAVAGTRAYGAVARLVPRSGGEYRYLTELLHPSLGYLAGWASLLVGFAAPIAASAVAAGYFAATLAPVPPLLVGSVVIVALTALHAGGFRLSRRTQDGLVVVKAVLLLGFAALGLAHAAGRWPAWTPPTPAESPVAAFAGSLFFVAFAFSGWNAAVYAAEEFADPRRDVPRAMLIGCLLVAALYLAVNWVFVATLTPEQASVVLTYESQRVTLGHLVMTELLGRAGGQAMSVLTIVAFVSSVSAMLFVGPRVYAAMANDGLLPRVFAAEAGRTPRASVVLQGVLALVLLFTHELQQILSNVGAILTLFAALVALSLFRVRFARPDLPRPSAGSLAAAAIYVAFAAWMLYFGFRGATHLVAWLVAIAGAALGFYGFTARYRGSRRATEA